MIPPLQTRRLLLQPLQLADADQIQRIFPVWEVVRLLASHVPWPYPDDGALTYVRDIALPAIARGVEWTWTLRLKSAPEQIIGCAMLARGDVNRGFWLGADWQRMGLMTEASQAITRFWFEDLGMSVLRAPKAVANAGSRKISQGEGMRVVQTGEKDFVVGRMPYELWEITAEEWKTLQQR